MCEVANGPAQRAHSGFLICAFFEIVAVKIGERNKKVSRKRMAGFAPDPVKMSERNKFQHGQASYGTSAVPEGYLVST